MYYWLKIHTYFLENSTTPFTVQHTTRNKHLKLKACLAVVHFTPTHAHLSSQVTAAWNCTFFFFFFFSHKCIQISNNNWKSVLGPNIFPSSTPPNSKGHCSEQSPLCCLFKDHVTRCIWQEHPLSCNTHSTSQPGLHRGELGSGKDGLFLECYYSCVLACTHMERPNRERRNSQKSCYTGICGATQDVRMLICTVINHVSSISVKIHNFIIKRW